MLDPGKQPQRRRCLRTAELVEVMAIHIRQAYIYERRLSEEMHTGRPSTYNSSSFWDGRPATQETSGRQAVWPRLAEFMLANQLDPAAYIHAAFQIQGWQHPPKPNQLKCAAVLDNYRRQSQQEQRAVEIAFAHQQSLFHATVRMLADPAALMTYEQSVQFVLLDENLSLSALFRYCIARRAKCFDIARRYRTSAAVQYVRQRELYDTVWGALIPPKFKMKAQSIRQSMLDKMLGGEGEKERHNG